MKIAVIIVRVLLGLLYVMSSVVVLFNLVKPPPMPDGPAKQFMEGMVATGYLLHLIKLTELTCGLLFVFGRFVPLATVMIFPVTLNIFLYHCFVPGPGLPMAICILTANLFLAYAHWDKYKPMLVAK
jgi:putative oxidoreductase